jgi:CheY-like chemotaxis protein
MVRRALICEDDPAIRALVRTVVMREGFEAEVAVDGREGMQKLREGCFDIVLLDLMMPGVDGYGVVEFIKAEQFPTIRKVVVMTAATDAIRSAFPEPICMLLAKPFDLRELTAALQHCAIACENGGAPT